VIEQNTVTLVGGKIDHNNYATKVPELLAKNEYKELNSYWTKWCLCENAKDQYGPLSQKTKKNLDNAKDKFETI
jgi:hypothetical protein